MRIENHLPRFLIVIMVICMLAMFCLPAGAQTPTPTPPPSPEPNEGAHFDVSTEYVKLTTGGNATVVSARLPLTPRYSVVYSQYQVPSAKAQIYQGEVEFREKLSHLIKSSAFQINLDNVQVYLRAGAGTKRDDLGNNPIFAYGVHAGADVVIGKIGGGTLLVGLKGGFLGIPRQKAGPRHFVLGSTPEIAPGLTVRF